MRRGVCRGKASHAGDTACTTLAMTSVTVSPPKAGRPASTSYSAQPNAQMSARLSTVLPRACSGDMYAAVPSIIPAAVIAGDVMVGEVVNPAGPPLALEPPDPGSRALARPKSNTFTVPSGRTLMFAASNRDG